MKYDELIIKEEIWLPIKGYEGLYEISSFGRVKSVERTLPHKHHGTWHIKEKILKLYWAGPSNSQYLTVWLHKGKGEQHIFRVHRLVAEHFISKIEGKNVVNHKDCDRSNNCADNLEWCTDLENTHHAIANGRFFNVGKWQKIPVVNVTTGERFDCINEACETYGVTHRAIWQVVHGRNATCCGCQWQLASEYEAGNPLRKSDNKNYRPVEQIDIATEKVVAQYFSLKEAEKETGTSRTSIGACCRGKSHTAGGYKWRYAI